jgi:preprotein translocase subunit SecA
MFKNIMQALGGDPHKREIQKITPVIEEINSFEAEFEKLSDDALRAKTDDFRKRVADAIEGIEDPKDRNKAEQDELDQILPEAFAVVREASKRTIGLRHYDVQMIGGYSLHKGQISEMRTGEGKTLVATLPLYLNALTGRGVHLVTVNDYLARRDARWMAPIYQLLGLSVGVLQMAHRTNNGVNAFLVDLEKTSPLEDQNQLNMVLRREAYQADITYGTNSEFGFDYLRDNLTMSLAERVQRGHYFAIVDEVDNILIDEARTPLIISGPASEDTELYNTMAKVVRQLNPDDYEVDEKDRSVSLTEIGEAHVEEILGQSLRDPERPEDITPEQARLLGHLEQALKAQSLYKRNKDYLVQSGKVVIVDEFTGRLMPGRRWSEGLHQAVEAKEGVKVEAENVTYATITLQNYFRMYQKLAGMTGTALTEAEEFAKIYKLEVLTIPTNLEYTALQKNSDLIELEDKDDEGYKFTYYSERSDLEKHPVFWKRKDYTDIVYRTEEAKFRSITREIIYNHVIGRPLLVGTASVEHSDLLSDRLQAEPVRRLLQTLLLRHLWMEKNNTTVIEKSVPELQVLNKPLSELNPSDLRPLAKSFDTSLNMEEEGNIARLLEMFGLPSAYNTRMVQIIKGGVPHQVLNARKHDEESMIIARAGAYGAVTIATNMAGRGVDIKLGGELPDDILRDVNRVLTKVTENPYDLTNEERLDLLKKMDPAEYGIYEPSVNEFFTYIENNKQVRELGGLHVIGSERHEARRIDNQLRGRAARQGDPGSSRFYLSLEDDLMRLFGGAQVEGIWKRMMIDDSQPIELGILGRLVEQSQERVEGSNFDIRKHLLEYDDVLNSQRTRIYGQRDRVFTKEDLSEDVLDMLHTELQNRVNTALKDEEGPWKLLAFLEEVQPAFEYEEFAYPSFAFRLLIDEIRNSLPEKEATRTEVQQAVLSLAEKALVAEREHTLRSVKDLLEKTEENLQNQISERVEALDNFFASISDSDEEVEPRHPTELVNELSETLRIPVRLTQEQTKSLATADETLRAGIQQQIDQLFTTLTVTRLIGTLERRLGESLNLRPADLISLTWQDISNHIMDAIEGIFEQRNSRLLGEQGVIQRDLESWFERESFKIDDDRSLTRLLVNISQGTRTVFDAKTHRKAVKRYNRLNYVFLAARMVENSSSEEINGRVLEHFENGLEVLEAARGKAEWNRLLQADVALGQLDPRVLQRLTEALGEDQLKELTGVKIADIDQQTSQSIIRVFGQFIQNELNRQLLLRVISDQWVDYLTKMEALRVSIGLEAYAQRDPLVQYKGRASDLFKELLSDVRMGVIGHIFTYQMRRASYLEAEAEAGGEEQPTEARETAGASANKVEQQTAGKKRKRHH